MVKKNYYALHHTHFLLGPCIASALGLLEQPTFVASAFHPRSFAERNEGVSMLRSYFATPAARHPARFEDTLKFDGKMLLE